MATLKDKIEVPSQELEKNAVPLPVATTRPGAGTDALFVVSMAIASAGNLVLGRHSMTAGWIESLSDDGLAAWIWRERVERVPPQSIATAVILLGFYLLAVCLHSRTFWKGPRTSRLLLLAMSSSAAGLLSKRYLRLLVVDLLPLGVTTLSFLELVTGF